MSHFVDNISHYESIVMQCSHAGAGHHGARGRGQTARRHRAGSGAGAGQGAESSPSSFSSVPMAGLPLAGAMMGLCLGGPVGVLAGAKLGGVAALGGSILGYTGAAVIKEQKDVRKHIDDHYRNEPRLYVLTPREEALLARHARRTSTSTSAAPSCGPALRPSQSVDISCATSPRSRRPQSESARHLPNVRSRRACYRSSRALSEQRSLSSSPSANSSPAARRRKLEDSGRQPPQPRQPPGLQPGQFRRLGDLSAEEQRSVIALIKAERGAADVFLAAPRSPRAAAARSPRSPRRRLPTIEIDGVSASSGGQTSASAESRRLQFARARQHSRRASSLPDVLEEDTGHGGNK